MEKCQIRRFKQTDFIYRSNYAQNYTRAATYLVLVKSARHFRLLILNKHHAFDSLPEFKRLNLKGSSDDGKHVAELKEEKLAGWRSSEVEVGLIVVNDEVAGLSWVEQLATCVNFV